MGTSKLLTTIAATLLLANGALASNTTLPSMYSSCPQATIPDGLENHVQYSQDCNTIFVEPAQGDFKAELFNVEVNEENFSRCDEVQEKIEKSNEHMARASEYLLKYLDHIGNDGSQGEMDRYYALYEEEWKKQQDYFNQIQDIFNLYSYSAEIRFDETWTDAALAISEANPDKQVVPMNVKQFGMHYGFSSTDTGIDFDNPVFGTGGNPTVESLNGSKEGNVYFTGSPYTVAGKFVTSSMIQKGSNMISCIYRGKDLSKMTLSEFGIFIINISFSYDVIDYNGEITNRYNTYYVTE